jgi:hypothetical protein
MDMYLSWRRACYGVSLLAFAELNWLRVPASPLISQLQYIADMHTAPILSIHNRKYSRTSLQNPALVTTDWCSKYLQTWYVQI